jgi:membrane protease YdiL (CAAX protease family)
MEIIFLKLYKIIIMNHLECVTPKKNKWYWYLLVLFLCFVAGNTVGSIPLVVVLLVTLIKSRGGFSDMTAIAKMDFNTAGLDLNLGLACILFVFAITLIAAIFIIKIMHERTWKGVINGTNRVRWSRFFFGFFVWGLISFVLFAISYYTEPELYVLRFQPVKFIFLVVIALIFFPFQTTCEEFLFRGYLAQGFGSWTKSRWWALFIPSILFGLLHSANPEIQEYGFGVMIVQYIFLGLILGFMSIMDDGIELAMGVHAVNNIFSALFFSFKGAALQTYALFEVTEVNQAEQILPLVISGIVVLAIFAFKYKWDFSVINKRI